MSVARWPDTTTHHPSPPLIPKQQAADNVQPGLYKRARQTANRDFVSRYILRAAGPPSVVRPMRCMHEAVLAWNTGQMATPSVVRPMRCMHEAELAWDTSQVATPSVAVHA